MLENEVEDTSYTEYPSKCVFTHFAVYHTHLPSTHSHTLSYTINFAYHTHAHTRTHARTSMPSANMVAPSEVTELRRLELEKEMPKDMFMGLYSVHVYMGVRTGIQWRQSIKYIFNGNLNQSTALFLHIIFAYSSQPVIDCPYGRATGVKVLGKLHQGIDIQCIQQRSCVDNGPSNSSRIG